MWSSHPVNRVSSVSDLDQGLDRVVLSVTELADGFRQILQRHLAVVTNSAAPDSALDVSMAALLTALGGGYEPEFRLKIVKGVLDRIDMAYYGLLAGHLEDIRAEAEDLGLDDLARQAAGLLDSLEGGE